MHYLKLVHTIKMKLAKLSVLLLASSQLVSAKPNLGAKNPLQKPSHRHTYREMMQARQKLLNLPDIRVESNLRL